MRGRLPCFIEGFLKIEFSVRLGACLSGLFDHFLLLSDAYSSLIALAGSRVDQDTIYKYLKTYSTLTNSGKTVILCWIPGHVGIPGNERADRVAKAALSLPISFRGITDTSKGDRKPWTSSHAPNYLMRKEWQEIGYGIAVMVTSFTLVLIPQWVLPNRMILSVGEMPSFSTGYRLVTRVLHTHVFLAMTKYSVPHVIFH